MVADCHRVLSVCLGEPPLTFDLEVPVGKNCRIKRPRLVEQSGDDRPACEKDAPRQALLVDRGITPREFAERYVPFDPERLRAARAACPARPARLATPSTAASPTPWPAGVRSRCSTLPVEVLEDAAVASLRAGRALRDGLRCGPAVPAQDRGLPRRARVRHDGLRGPLRRRPLHGPRRDDRRGTRRATPTR